VSSSSSSCSIGSSLVSCLLFLVFVLGFLCLFFFMIRDNKFVEVNIVMREYRVLWPPSSGSEGRQDWRRSRVLVKPKDPLVALGVSMCSFFQAWKETFLFFYNFFFPPLISWVKHRTYSIKQEKLIYIGKTCHRVCFM